MAQLAALARRYGDTHDYNSIIGSSSDAAVEAEAMDKDAQRLWDSYAMLRRG